MTENDKIVKIFKAATILKKKTIKTLFPEMFRELWEIVARLPC